MASWRSNTYQGRYLELTITETIDPVGNKSNLTWKFSSVGGQVAWYGVDETTITINGQQVYHCNRTTGNTFPAAKGSVSGSLSVTHDASGAKTINVSFKTSVYVWGSKEYGGSMTLTKIDRSGPSVSFNVSGITSNSCFITAHSNVTSDRWEYNLGSSWVQFSTSAGTSATKTITGLTPNTQYSVKVRARKQYNAVYGESGAQAVKTLGATVLNRVELLQIDVNLVLSLNWTVYDGSYTHKLVINTGSDVVTITGLTGTAGTATKTVTLTSEQQTAILKSMVNASTVSATYKLTTYKGSEQIGSVSTNRGTITVSPRSAPTFSTFTYADVNSLTTEITGDNQVCVQSQSKLRITCGAATAKQFATISKYRATIGNKTVESGTTTIEFNDIPISGNVTLTVTAIDSRGLSKSTTKQITVLEYTPIKIDSWTVRRVNNFDDEIQVSLKGSFSPIMVGDVAKNTLEKAEYKYKQSSAREYGESTVIQGVKSEIGSFSFQTDNLISLDSSNSYYIEIAVSDKFTTSKQEFLVGVGKPLVSFRSGKIGINTNNPAKALDVDGDVNATGTISGKTVQMNGVNVMGFVKELGNTEDLNDLIQPGWYIQKAHANASADRNYPAGAGYLEVITDSVENPQRWVLQRYTVLNGDTMYIRSYAWTSSSESPIERKWYPWQKITLTNVQTVQEEEE